MRSICLLSVCLSVVFVSCGEKSVSDKSSPDRNSSLASTPGKTAPVKSSDGQPTPKKAVAPFVPPTALERSYFALEAARLNRVADIMIAEAEGMDIRSGLEKSHDRLSTTMLSLADKGLISSQIKGMNDQSEYLETQRKKAEANPAADKVRLEKLAAIKEIQKYRTAQKHLLSVVRKRQDLIDRDKRRGKDLRSGLEKATDKFVVALKENEEYRKAVEQLKAEEAGHAGLIGLFTHAPSTVLRAALIRCENKRR
jgi:hypothetical protein